jgi:hypothetical protein
MTDLMTFPVREIVGKMGTEMVRTVDLTVTMNAETRAINIMKHGYVAVKTLEIQKTCV